MKVQIEIDDEYEDYLDSLSDEECEKEMEWLGSIALAIQQGKNVAPNPARHYDYRM